MVCLDQLRPPARQGTRRAFNQVLQHDHADTEVGGPKYRYPVPSRFQSCAQRRRQSRGAGNQRATALPTQHQQRIEGFGQAEVDCDIELRCGVEVDAAKRQCAAGDALPGHGSHDPQVGRCGGEA